MTAALLAGCGSGSSSSRATLADRSSGGGEFRVETVASELDTPWDLAWGPDGNLWFTERGGAISHVNLSTGRVTRVGRVDVVEVSESGLMGMAFHPNFAEEPFVYLVHSYDGEGGVRNRLVRVRYDGTSLGAPETLLNGIPGSGNHNGSRLVAGPDRFLYMTTGDAQDPELAQDRASLAGKVLRLTLDGRPAPGNPFGNAVYSYGHRNAQGIAFHPGTGALYVTEHGPTSDDEINRIEAGRNYGWPEVSGACDADDSDERAFCEEHDVVEPLATWTPTIAVAGAEFYDADLIPGWRGSLLVTALRGASLVRITLATDGSRIVAREELLAGTYGRLRDVLVAPSGEVYLAVSNRDGRGSPRPRDDRILRMRP